MKRIDFLMPQESTNGVLYTMLHDICEAFARKGFSTRVISIEEHFTVPVNDPPDFTFSFNMPLMDDDGRFLCDIIQKNHFSYLLDPPYRFMELFESPYVYVGCDDRYYSVILKDIEFEKSWFLPHGANREIRFDPKVERDIDVLMLGSFTDFEKLRKQWYKVFPDIISMTMDDAVEATFSDSHTSFMEAFVDAYQKRIGSSEKPQKILRDFSLPLTLLERYIKGKERVNLVTSIRDAEVHIFGGASDSEIGWEDFLEDRHPNVISHDPVDYVSSLELIKRAKIVLNAFSKNKEGTHERVFNGLASGALVLTNESSFLKESFTDEENILFYRPDQFDAVNDKINRYLNDEDLRRKVAEKGRNVVFAQHTWDHRIEALSDVWNHILPK